MLASSTAVGRSDVDANPSTKSNLITITNFLMNRPPYDTAETFADCLSQHSAPFAPAEPKEWIFRGVGATEYKLIPNALRSDITLLGDDGRLHDSPLPGDRSLEEQVKLEFQTFLLFVRASDDEGLFIPGDCPQFRDLLDRYEFRRRDDMPGLLLTWPPNEFLSALALAQHQGVATRLLDWSYNPFVAAYFAVKSAIQLDGNPSTFHMTPDIVVWAMSDAVRKPIEIRTRGQTPQERRGVWRVNIPAFGNVPLKAQRGLFTLYDPAPASSGDKVDLRCLDQLRQRGLVKNLFRFSLKYGQARRLLRLLAKEGVSASTMWPGYAGAAEEIKERALWER
jgi:hypothetical protein